MRIRITVDKIVEVVGLDEPEEIEDKFDEDRHDAAERRAVDIVMDYLGDQSKDTLIEWMDFNQSPFGDDLDIDSDSVIPDVTLYPEEEKVPDGKGEWSTYTRDG